MKRLLFILFIFSSIYGFSTNKYWGGNGNSNDATHWYTDSTFSTTTTVPGTGDNAYFTKAAGNVTCTINATFSCLNFDCHGWGGTIAGSSNIRLYGDLYLGGTWSNISSFSLRNTSGTQILQTNGKQILNITRFGSGGTTQIVGTLTCDYIALQDGTVDLNGQTINIGYISSGGTGTKNLTCGNADITLNALQGLDLLTGETGLTFNANQSTFHLINSSGTTVFKGNGNTFYNVYFDGTTGGGIISGNNTFTNLKLAPASSKTYQFTDATTQTISGDFIATGTASIAITIRSTATSGTSPVIQSSAQIGCLNDYVINGASGASYYGISFAQVGGVGSGYLGANSTDYGDNTGWNYTACPSVSMGIPFFWSPF